MSCKNKGLLIKCKVEKLINDAENVVYENLRGIAMLNSGLVVLDGYNAILRRDYCDITNKVKLISGGGSGNEPTHSGFVGPGMLTAAVFGNINSAPTVNSIFQVIKELGTNSPKGILLIVQNHPGYVLNFTLAKIKAEMDGINIKILIIEDEASVSKIKKTSRGLLGTLFIHKIAGAMAEKEATLEDIFYRCNTIAKNDITSIGICTRIPSFCTNELKCKELDIGYGIHGEQGQRRINFASSHEIVSTLLNILLNDKESLVQNKEIAVMISNLGGCSQLETNIFIKEVVEQLTKLGYKILKIYANYLMTSMNNSGLHISLLSIKQQDILEFLCTKTLAPSWPVAFSAENLQYDFEYDFSNITKVGQYAKNDEKTKEDSAVLPNVGPKLGDSSAEAFNTIVMFACDALIACADQLDIIDQDSGDGDCGTSLATGALAVKTAAMNNHLTTTRPAIALSQISTIVQNTMHGMQGGLYSILFDVASQVFACTNETDDINACLWLRALNESIKSISEITGTKKDDRTMLDSLIAAEEIFEKCLFSGCSPIEAFGQAVKAAEEKAISTTLMNAKVGKASLIENPIFVRPDAGAHAVGIWMRATYEGIKLKFSGYKILDENSK